MVLSGDHRSNDPLSFLVLGIGDTVSRDHLFPEIHEFKTSVKALNR